MKNSVFGWLAMLLAGCLTITSFSGCGTVPVTGRRQLNFISAGQELQLGLSSFEQMKQGMTINRDPQINAMVQRVGQRIAAVASPDLPEAQWEFVVFEDEQMNAFCLPGGKVGIFTGILKVTQDEAGLATVVGHEVAHAAARHGAERMSQHLLMQTGSQVVAAGLSGADPRMQMAATVAFGLGAQLGVALPHSRRQEAEADEIGLIYMARAGYNPQAAVDFWTRFAAATGADGGVPWFLRTHPLSQDRIEHLQRLMPQALEEYRQDSRVSF
jgi:metalloendopeptidase OMA1, mitochondrial